MRRLLFICVFFLASCTVKDMLPETYSGPTALVKDTFASNQEGGFFTEQKVNLFVMSSVDGKLIENGAMQTAKASLRSSLGYVVKPQAYERRVPVQPMKVVIEGVEYYGAGGGPNSRVRREVKFHPNAGQTYVVRGKMDANNSLVWIETADGQVVTP